MFLNHLVQGAAGFPVQDFLEKMIEYDLIPQKDYQKWMKKREKYIRDQIKRIDDAEKEKRMPRSPTSLSFPGGYH